MKTYITSHIGIIVLILIWNSSRPLYNLYEYSGTRAIWEKLSPPPPKYMDNSPKPSTFMLWIMSIYFVLFGIASNRYEQTVHSYELRVLNFQTQMASEYRAEACVNLARLQKMRVPIKPIVYDFYDTISSFFAEEEYTEGQKLLISILEMYRFDLNKANLIGANMSGAYLYKADLRRAKLYRANLTKTNLKKANLKKADLSGAKLIKAKLTNCNLTKAKLKGVDLTQANLTKANMEGANFKGAYLLSADLKESNLHDAYFKKANLKKVNFKGANLIGANLTDTNLTGANLTRANLNDAKLSGSNLTGAILVQTNLMGVDLTEVDITKAKTLYKAKLPISAKKALKKAYPQLFAQPHWYKYANTSKHTS
ncbi:pentapeptide repeat-containing protein [Maridesulfovibrio sp.]|uniref:pentapeptide repeat-containing protein n=1 Tax=Maridesulfovibrio sp. TaxID=2795000 RepID=UPI002A18742B|nr:pentapeptide repeat-containing protein [Maridesulfovibrio sp.]